VIEEEGIRRMYDIEQDSHRTFRVTLANLSNAALGIILRQRACLWMRRVASVVILLQTFGSLHSTTQWTCSELLEWGKLS
jgi:hypothetical protein